MMMMDQDAGYPCDLSPVFPLADPSEWMTRSPGRLSQFTLAWFVRQKCQGVSFAQRRKLGDHLLRSIQENADRFSAVAGFFFPSFRLPDTPLDPTDPNAPTFTFQENPYPVRVVDDNDVFSEPDLCENPPPLAEGCQEQWTRANFVSWPEPLIACTQEMVRDLLTHHLNPECPLCRQFPLTPELVLLGGLSPLDKCVVDWLWGFEVVSQIVANPRYTEQLARSSRCPCRLFRDHRVVDRFIDNAETPETLFEEWNADREPQYLLNTARHAFEPQFHFDGHSSLIDLITRAVKDCSDPSHPLKTQQEGVNFLFGILRELGTSDGLVAIAYHAPNSTSLSPTILCLVPWMGNQRTLGRLFQLFEFEHRPGLDLVPSFDESEKEEMTFQRYEKRQEMGRALQMRTHPSYQCRCGHHSQERQHHPWCFFLTPNRANVMDCNVPRQHLPTLLKIQDTLRALCHSSSSSWFSPELRLLETVLPEMSDPDRLAQRCPYLILEDLMSPCLTKN